MTSIGIGLFYAASNGSKSIVSYLLRDVNSSRLCSRVVSKWVHWPSCSRLLTIAKESEGDVPVIEMHDDDPMVLKDLLAFLYTQADDTIKTTIKNLIVPVGTHRSYAAWRYIFTLPVMADKYDQPTLLRFLADIFMSNGYWGGTVKAVSLDCTIGELLHALDPLYEAAGSPSLRAFRKYTVMVIVHTRSGWEKFDNWGVQDEELNYPGMLRSQMEKWPELAQDLLEEMTKRMLNAEQTTLAASRIA
jgi:hypothetical protein